MFIMASKKFTTKAPTPEVSIKLLLIFRKIMKSVKEGVMSKTHKRKFINKLIDLDALIGLLLHSK